jgi:hypothetical protein
MMKAQPRTIAERCNTGSPAHQPCRYGQIHRGVDTGPGDRRADRIFQTITMGLMFPSAARSIAVDGGGMGQAMRSPAFPPSLFDGRTATNSPIETLRAVTTPLNGADTVV